MAPAVAAVANYELIVPVACTPIAEYLRVA
jgi:hypothetical protein